MVHKLPPQCRPDIQPVCPSCFYKCVSNATTFVSHDSQGSCGLLGKESASYYFADLAKRYSVASTQMGAHYQCSTSQAIDVAFSKCGDCENGMVSKKGSNIEVEDITK